MLCGRNYPNIKLNLMQENENKVEEAKPEAEPADTATPTVEEAPATA